MFGIKSMFSDRGGDEETPCFQRSRALTHQISQTKTDGSFTREQACE